MKLLPILALLLTGCTSPIASRFAAEPIDVEPTAPACVTCNDALAGESGDLCDAGAKAADALEVCSERECLDECDDNLFRSIGQPREAGCFACLKARCGGRLDACRGL